MARETLVQKRATKLEKLKALQAEIDGLDKKTSKRIGDLAVRAGLAKLDVSDVELCCGSSEPSFRDWARGQWRASRRRLRLNLRSRKTRDRGDVRERQIVPG